MGFQIKQGRYIARMYFGDLNHPHGNVLAFLYRDRPAEDQVWLFQYRFRYYEDSKIYQSADKRSQDYIYEMKGPFEEHLVKVRQILTLMTMAAGSPFPDEVVVESDDVEVIGQILYAQPWAHPEEAAGDHQESESPIG